MPRHPTSAAGAAASPRDPRPIEGVATSVAAFVGLADRGPVAEAVVVNSRREFERGFGGLTTEASLSFAVRDFFANGGGTAVVVRVESTGVDGVLAGLDALESVELVNLLVIRPDGAAPDSPVDPAAVRAAVAAAAEFCERRRAMLIVDPPSEWTTVDAVVDAASGDGFAASLGTASANAALYFPRVRQPHPLHGGLGTFAASGAIAGVIARADATGGVWSAPAGLDAALTDVSGFDVALAERDLSRLNVLGVNVLREVASAGPVVWGARTLQGADTASSEWKYVPVRRTALSLEESIERGLQWAASEPNDEMLWASVRASVDTFMLGLFRAGAFRGNTPREAFFVQCHRGRTMTQADVDGGRLTVAVGFAPLKPAEFIVLQIHARARPAVA